MATLEDVARECGVSPGTVSRVLNNRKGIAPSTRARILEASVRLNYQCDAAAKGLRTGRTMMIGVVVPLLDSDYFQRIIAGVENAVRARGYNTVICNSEISLEQEREIVRLFLRRTVDGLIFTQPLMSDAELQQIAREGVRLAVVGKPVMGDQSVPVAVADNEKGACDAVAHLVEKHGRTRIAYIHGPPDSLDDTYRFSGYRKALVDKGIPFVPELTGYDWGIHDSGAIVLERIVKLGQKPDAVFCFDDELAYGVYRMAKKLRLSIPGDLAVIGVDNTKVGQHISPGLTSVDIPTVEMGKLTADKLIDQIEGKPDNNGVHIFPTTLVVRGSCGCGEREP